MSSSPVTLEIETALPIPAHLTGEIQSKLAYVDEAILQARVQTDKITLVLREEPIEAHKENVLNAVKEKVARVVSSMVKGAIQPKIQVLENHIDRPVSYRLDPMTELARRGEISQEANGIYTLGPLLSRLVNFFEKQFLDLAGTFGAAPYRFPTLIPARYMERVNYFRSFPHSLSFVTHLREDLDVIDTFAQAACCDEAGVLHAGKPGLNESFAPIQTLLSPAVCYHLYFSLADRPLPGGKLAATAVGNCFRYESINLNSLERLWNFSMREIIFVGPKDYVLENREIGRQRMAGVLEKIGLAYQVESANDPFFIGEFRKQAAFQSAFQLKFEIRGLLPFKSSTLAVGSYNYHQDFFGRSLNITLPDGGPVHTGCIAFGLERIAFAFLAQFGLDPSQWPVYVADNIQFP